MKDGIPTQLDYWTMKEVKLEIRQFGGWKNAPQSLKDRYLELEKFREKKLKEKQLLEN